MGQWVKSPTETTWVAAWARWVSGLAPWVSRSALLPVRARALMPSPPENLQMSWVWPLKKKKKKSGCGTLVFLKEAG